MWPTVPLDATFPYHFRLAVSPVARRANSMGEVLLHGWDLAQAMEAAWELPIADTARNGTCWIRSVGNNRAAVLRCPYR